MKESSLQAAVLSWQSLLGLPNLIWLSRLTAGIYALTKVLNAKKVIVPNNCCLNVVYGVLLGGAEPVFCDIDIKTGSLNVNACEELLERTKVEMVVHVHLYGLYSDRIPIHQLCRRFGAMYFEDGACWFPPVPNYEILPASCLGLSFGAKKIFELGGGGILCCTDTSLACEVRRCLEFLPEQTGVLPDYESVYGKMVGADRLPLSDKSDFLSLAFQFRELWINNTGYSVDALSKSEVDDERRRRQDLAAIIAQELSEYRDDVEIMFADTSLSFPWRFSFLTKNNGLVRRLFGENGFFVSRLYPPLDRFFPTFERSECLDNSYRCGAEIFNIPLDAGASIDRIKRAFMAYRRPPLKRRLIRLARQISRH
jgi:dTDP-4-amino-4,6-dideoxygalactose transaminase